MLKTNILNKLYTFQAITAEPDNDVEDHFSQVRNPSYLSNLQMSANFF